MFSRTSDQLLEELFGVFGANVPDLLDNSGEKEKKSKKKKKRKHDGDSDADSVKSKHKKSKKSKKVKQEPSSDAEDSKEKLRKAIKKEKKDKDGEKKSIKKEVTERRKLSIVIKDLKFRSEIVKPSKESSSTRDREREREKEKEKEKRREREKHRKSHDKKSSGNVSDVSLSDEETYRKMLEYHTSSQWQRDTRDDGYRGGHVREWDRDKYRRGRSRDDDRQ